MIEGQTQQTGSPAGDADSVCLMCEQNRAEIRGQCRRCRQGTRRDIAAGRLTEQELIDKGLLLPSVQGRRRSKPPWRQKLEQMRAKG